jgi:WD40 repeat protein
MPVHAVSFSPDGQSLLTAAGGVDGNSTIRAWSLTETNASADLVLDGGAAEAGQFAITDDGRWLVTASQEPALRVHDLTALDQPDSDISLSGLTSPVQTMALSANGRWLAAAGADNTVCLWYIGSTGPVATPVTIHAARGQITGMALVGQGDWLATGNDRGVIQLWNLQVDELIRMANAQVQQ